MQALFLYHVYSLKIRNRIKVKSLLGLILFFYINLVEARQCEYVLRALVIQGLSVENGSYSQGAESVYLGGNSGRAVYRVKGKRGLRIKKHYPDQQQLDNDYEAFTLLNTLLNKTDELNFGVLTAEKSPPHLYLTLTDEPGVDFRTFLRDPTIPSSAKILLLDKWEQKIKSLNQKLLKQFGDRVTYHGYSSLRQVIFHQQN